LIWRRTQRRGIDRRWLPSRRPRKFRRSKYSEDELLAVLKRNPEKGSSSKWEALAELMLLPSVQYEVTYRTRPKREKKRDRRAKKKR
jgi:hypothetical protein